MSGRMRLASHVLAGTLALFAALFAIGVPAGADESLDEARVRFVRTRDVCALTKALAPQSGADEMTRTDTLLAWLACDRKLDAAATNERGYAALPAVVRALKAMDLAAATEAVERVGDRTAGGIAVWARALIEARRGQDAAAVGHLLALEDPPPEEADRSTFVLALFGACLPDDDRLILAATGRNALLQSCSKGGIDRIRRLSLSLAALDRQIGADALCLAFRALRRLRQDELANALIQAPEAAGLSDAWSCYRLERAIAFWRFGMPDDARAIAVTLAAPPGCAFLVEALRRTTHAVRVPTPLDPPSPVDFPAHVPPPRRAAAAVARFATALGIPTTEDEAAAFAHSHGGGGIAAPEVLRAFLEGKGLTVVFAAGSDRPAQAAMTRKLPFLLHQIRLEGDAFVDVPILVRGQDESTGLWFTEETDLLRQDALPPNAPRKGWLTIAMPREMCPSVASWVEPQEQQLGRAITMALDIAARGDLAGATALLDSQAVNLDRFAAFHLYRGYLLRRRFDASPQEPRFLQLALEAVRKSAPTAPTLAFEHITRGVSPWIPRSQEEQEEAIQACELASRLEPNSAWLALLRHQLFWEGHHRQRSLDALELARLLDPLDTRALYSRGGARYHGGETAAARADLKRAFERAPSNQEVALSLVRLELDRRDAGAAFDVLNQYVASDPEVALEDEVQGVRLEVEARIVEAASTVGDVEPFISSPLSDVRRRVAFALARFETPEAESALRRLLDDPHHTVRATVLKLYMRPWLRAYVERDDSLWKKVVERLRDDKNQYVRGAAAGLIGLVARPAEAVRELAPRLVGSSRDAEPYPRSLVAEALGNHDTEADATACRTLIEALNDENRDVRHSVIETLFRLAFTYHGFDPDGAPAERAKAVERWRRWLRER